MRKIGPRHGVTTEAAMATTTRRYCRRSYARRTSLTTKLVGSSTQSRARIGTHNYFSSQAGRGRGHPGCRVQMQCKKSILARLLKTKNRGWRRCAILRAFFSIPTASSKQSEYEPSYALLAWLLLMS